MPKVHDYKKCPNCGKSVGITIHEMIVRHNTPKGKYCPASGHYHDTLERKGDRQRRLERGE